MTNRYLLQVEETKPSREVLAALLNIDRNARVLFGYGVTTLWVLPGGSKRPQEVLERLQSLQGIQHFSVVNLSKPVEVEEASVLRQMFNGFGVDTSEITDVQLCSFLDAFIECREAFYIDTVEGTTPESPVRMLIKPIEEHPQFSPEWLKPRSVREQDTNDKEYTADDIEIETLQFDLLDGDELPDPDREAPPGSD